MGYAPLIQGAFSTMVLLLRAPLGPGWLHNGPIMGTQIASVTPFGIIYGINRIPLNTNSDDVGMDPIGDPIPDPIWARP